MEMSDADNKLVHQRLESPSRDRLSDRLRMIMDDLLRDAASVCDNLDLCTGAVNSPKNHVRNIRTPYRCFYPPE
jgi:hypothetical protein